MGPMRIFLSLFLGGTLLFSFPLPVKASQATLEKRYLEAYKLVREAFDAKKSGNLKGALLTFKTINQILQGIQNEDPNWHSQTIIYLAQDCERQIAELGQQVPVSEQEGAEEKVDQLVHALVTIQKNRASVETPEPQLESLQPRPQLVQKEEKKSKFSSLTSLIRRKGQPQEEPKEVPQRDPQMQSEKVEALEAVFLKKKEESDQWRLQYSILEEKAREEIQSLSSEFAKEKTDFEVEIASLKKELSNQKAQQQSLQQAQQKIEELERALEEAQSIRSKAEEESKIMEGQIVLQLKTDFQNQLQAQKREYEQSLSQLKQSITEKEQALKDLEERLSSQNSKNIAEKSSRIAELEQKVLTVVREKAVVEQELAEAKAEQGKIAELEAQIQSKEKIIAEKEKELEAEKKIASGSEEQKKRIAQLEQKNKELDQNLNESQAKIAKFEEERTYFLEQEKKLAELKKSSELEKTEWGQKTARLEQDLNKAQFELASKGGSVRQALVEADAKLAQVKSENEKTIMNLLESFKREKKKWELSSDPNQTKIAESVKKTEAELKETLEKNELLRREVESLKKQVAQAKERGEGEGKLSQEQANQIETFQNRIDELRKLLESSENEKKDLYEEVNQANSTLAQLKLDLKRTEDVNIQLRDTVSQLQVGSAVVTAPVSEKMPVVVQEKPSEKKEITPAVNVSPKKVIKKQALTEKEVNKIVEKIKDFFRKKKFNEALELLQQQLKMHPSNDRFLFYRGLVYSRMNKLDEAIQAYEETIAVNPKFAKAFNNLGNLYSQQKKYGKAIENLKKATEFDAGLSEAYNNMGIVYSHLGQFDESIKAFIKATELNPQLVAAYYNLGQIYYHDKKWDAAATSFEKVLSLKSDHVEAKDYIAQIRKLKKNRKTDLALEPQE